MPVKATNFEDVKKMKVDLHFEIVIFPVMHIQRRSYSYSFGPYKSSSISSTAVRSIGFSAENPAIAAMYSSR